MKPLVFIITLLLSVTTFGQSTKKASPIFIVDNIVVDRHFIAALDPENIETLNVVKPQNTNNLHLDDLSKNGIIEIKTKTNKAIDFLNYLQAKEFYNLPINTEVHLNNIKINEVAILLSKDMILKARILKPDNVNKLKNPVLALETGTL